LPCGEQGLAGITLDGNIKNELNYDKALAILKAI